MKEAGVKVSLSFFLIVLVCILPFSQCIADGDNAEGPNFHNMQMLESNTTGDACADAPTPVAYYEAVRYDNTISMGSWRWMAYTEALNYHPSLPLPQAYKECSIQACIVALSTASLPQNMKAGHVITVSASPRDIQRILAHYSDGVTVYRLEFIVGNFANDSIMKQKIGETGNLLMSRETNAIEGISLQRDGFSVNIYDGDAGDLFEITAGLSIYPSRSGTSKVTEGNASILLQDPELTELFEALIAYVMP